MKYCLMILFLMFNILICAEFEIVKEIEMRSGDLTAQRYPHKDVNGQWCAILKVYTDIQGLSFDGRGYEKHDIRDGVFIVYLQAESKNIIFKKEGVNQKQYIFPYKLEPNTVYSVEIKTDEVTSTEISANISGTPESALIFLDGRELGRVNFFKAVIGKHELKVRKEGFKEKIIQIELTPERTEFAYSLDKAETVSFIIETEPDGASVFLDGIMIGTSPVNAEYPEGEYMLRISKGSYGDIEETVSAYSPGLSKKYILSDNSAYLTLNTCKRAKVFINGKRISEYKNMKLNPQIVNIRIEKKFHKTLEKKIIIKKNEKITLDLYPEKIPNAVNNHKSSVESVLVEGKSGMESFYISKYEITQKQWLKTAEKWEYEEYMKEYIGDSYPIYGIHLYQITDFCNRLSEAEGFEKCYSLDGENIICDFNADGYRVPTEAEWEYAAKGGTKSKGYKYSGSNLISEAAVYNKGDGKQILQKIGSKKPNELGLYDMSGNIEEICWDYYDKEPDVYLSRACRGGSYVSEKDGCMISSRSSVYSSLQNINLGFRIVRPAE